MAFMRKIFGGNDEDKYENDSVGYEDEYEEDVQDNEEELDYDEPEFTGSSSKIVSMPSSTSNSDAKFNMIIFNPVRGLSIA